MKLSLLVLIAFLCGYCYSQALPTLYEYYTSGGIKSGLTASSEHFMLNGKQITLLSGSLHYFRVPHQLWKDRLTKFKAAGLNAVQFYSPWNLHEETPGTWDFTGMLDLEAFLKAIKEADMFAIYRPGPYICAEWEMGGFPAWLLRDSAMKLRTNYKSYMDHSATYYNKVLSIANKYQFSVNGGPIIAMQLENEYGGTGSAAALEYLNFLKDTTTKSGFKELLFTSDPGSKAQANPIKNWNAGVLETINLNDQALTLLTELRKNQPNKPLYVSEFWPGWFDNWGDAHHTYTVSKFETQVTDTLWKANSSINFYMFHGGTNFGFMNGGHVVTSYDYNAPLSESGNYTDKYYKTKELFEKFRKERGEPMVQTPAVPAVENPAHYGVVKITDYLPYNQILAKAKALKSDKPKQMEYLDVGSNYGQNFGFVLYRTTVSKISKLTIKGGVADRGIIAIDNKEVATVEQTTDYTLTTSATTGSEHTVDILVENTGRVNGGNMNDARKGIHGDVLVDDVVHTGWTIYPLDFKQAFVESLVSEKGTAFENIKSPAVFRAQLDITGAPKDTFLKLDGWTKGNAFVNGFNLGRYYNKGPQKTLYVPAPMLKTGKNDVYLFELHSAGASVEFVDKPVLG